MRKKIALAQVLAVLFICLIFLPLLPGLALLASPLFDRHILLSVLQDNQLPLAALSTLISVLISVFGALLLTLLIICGLYPGPAWRRYVHRLPLLLALPHVAFASGLLFLFSEHGWLARLLHSHLPVENSGIGLGLLLGLKEAWFLLWFASTQLDEQRLAQQLILARSMGYGVLQSRLLVIIPQLLPRLGWAMLAVMAYSLSAVDVGIILGPGNPPTLAVLAWQWMNDSDTQQQAMGMALSLLLMIILAGLSFAGRLLWHCIHQQLSTLFRWRLRFDIRLLASCTTATMTLAGIASIVILLIWSLAAGWFYPALWPDAVSFSGWQFSRYDTLWTATGLALASSLLATTGVLLWLEGCSRRADILLLFPLFLPALPLAAGQYQIILRIALEGSWPAVIWSHLLWVIPYTLLVVKPAWLQLDRRHAITARTFGWSDWKVLWLIKTPLLLRPLLGSIAVGFSVSVAQYLPTLYTGAGRFATVTTEAVALSSGGDPQQLAIQALLQTLLPTGIFIITIQTARLAGYYRQGLR